MCLLRTLNFFLSDHRLKIVILVLVEQTNGRYLMIYRFIERDKLDSVNLVSFKTTNPRV